MAAVAKFTISATSALTEALNLTPRLDNTMNLYEAIRDNDVKKVKSILSKNRNVVNVSRAYGSPLLISAEGGYIEIIKILLKHHADPNSTDSNGWTPLISACQFNHLNAVQLLLENNADPNLQCSLGNTALHAAARNDNVKILQVLLDHGSHMDVMNVDGWTPLHRAVYSNRINAAKFLLEKGADVTIRSKSGRTPYNTAVHMRLYDLAQVLRKYERNVSVSEVSEGVNNNTSLSSKPRTRQNTRKKDPLKAFALRLGLLKRDQHSNNRIQTLTGEQPGPVFTNLRNSPTTSRQSTTNVCTPTTNSRLSMTETNGDDDTDDSEDEDDGIKNECPICFEVPLPPTHIYQCTNGHIYCGKCKRKPNMTKCPQCGINISGTANRNRYAEEHIAETYKKKTK